jgi:small subunit ribosomal protein S17
MEENQKTRVGRVVSNKMNKTIIVAVQTPKHHPLYHKTIKREVSYKVHDEKNECKPGDVIKMIECRPLSKEKRWRVAEIVTKGEVVEVQPKEIT